MTAPSDATAVMPPQASADERILDATVTLLAQKGIGGTSMRAVAREAGVAVGLANYHFSNKTALVCSALRRVGERDIQLVTPPAGIDGPDALRHCLGQAFAPQYLAPAYLSLRLQLWSLAGVDPQFAEINQDAQRRYLDGLANLISGARPDLGRSEVASRAADVLVVQNGVWLTAILIRDESAIARALDRCESVAFT